MSFTTSKFTNFSSNNASGTAGHQGADSTSSTTAFDVVMALAQNLEVNATLATLTAATLYDNTSTGLPAQQPTAAKFLWFKSDQDVYIKIEGGTAAGAADGGITLRVKANDPISLVVSTIGSTYTAGAIAAAPTARVLVRVSVYNDSTNTANLQLVLQA